LAIPSRRSGWSSTARIRILAPSWLMVSAARPGRKGGNINAGSAAEHSDVQKIRVPHVRLGDASASYEGFMRLDWGPSRSAIRATLMASGATRERRIEQAHSDSFG